MERHFSFAPDRPNDSVIAFGRVFVDQKAVDAFVAAADRLAGRKVSLKELDSPWGVHADNYTRQPPRIHAEDRLWQPIVETVKQDDNPYRQHGQGIVDHQRRERQAHGVPQDREARYAQLAAEWDQRKSAEAAAASHAEAIRPVREAAYALHDRLRFDPSVPLDELRAVVRATKQIEQGNLGIGRQMLGDALAVETDRLIAAEASLKSELEGKLAAIKSKLADRPNIETTPGMTHAEFMALDPAERVKTDYYREHFKPVEND
jgi:hypothetical protein